MQNKLRQLVITSLLRNEETAALPLNVTATGYNVTVSGNVRTEAMHQEAMTTIGAVSPHIRITSEIKVLDID